VKRVTARQAHAPGRVVEAPAFDLVDPDHDAIGALAILAPRSSPRSPRSKPDGAAPDG